MPQRHATGKNASTLIKTVFPRSPYFSSHKEGEDFEFGETMEEYTRPLRVPRPEKRRAGRPTIHEIGSGSPVRLLSPSLFPLMLTTARLGGGVRTRIRRYLQGVATSIGPDADRGQRTDKTAQFAPRL